MSVDLFKKAGCDTTSLLFGFGETFNYRTCIISGNDRTNEHVIRRELRTLPGQKFSRTNIIRDQQQLAQMGYFDPEQISINPIPNPADNTVDIEYGLVEKPSDQIELSGGWGGFYGFVGANFSSRRIIVKKSSLCIGDPSRTEVRSYSRVRLAAILRELKFAPTGLMFVTD